jgi:hypothetical protein
MISAVIPYLLKATDPTRFNVSSVATLTAALCFERALQMLTPAYNSDKGVYKLYFAKYTLAPICRGAQFYIAHRLVKQAFSVNKNIAGVHRLIDLIFYYSLYFASLQTLNDKTSYYKFHKPAIDANRALNGLVKVVNIVAAVATMRYYSNQSIAVVGIVISAIAFMNLRKDVEQLGANRIAMRRFILPTLRNLFFPQS